MTLPRPLLALLALSACQQATPKPQPTGPDISAQVVALPRVQREITLFRAIRDAGQDCQDLTTTKRLPPVGGNPAWLVTCRPTSYWVVAIARDGTALVTDARTAAGGPAR